MDLQAVIKSRASAREFSSTEVSNEWIDEMLEAARLAPSGGNSQGTRIGVIRDNEIKSQLARAAGNQMWIASAPVIFALCADISWDLKDQPQDDFGLAVNYLRFGEDFVRYTNEYPDRKAMNKLYDDSTPLISGEHIFLTAVSHGMSACFVGYLDTERASAILGLPETVSCLFLLPVGFPVRPLTPVPKKEIEEIAFYDKWSEQEEQTCKLR
jgi:nitroreductase